MENKFTPRACAECGTVFVPTKSERPRFCSRSCIGKGNRGRRPHNKDTSEGWVDQRGYRQIRVGGKRVKEHRYIMEQHLGRRLEPWESVHHIDNNKQNNAIDNLEVVTAEEHAGRHKQKQRSDSANRSIKIAQEMTWAIKKLTKQNTDLLDFVRDVQEIVACFCDGPGEACFKCRARALLRKIEGDK